jgi:hypothetical protein
MAALKVSATGQAGSMPDLQHRSVPLSRQAWQCQHMSNSKVLVKF